jgi:hypothetical protein
MALRTKLARPLDTGRTAAGCAPLSFTRHRSHFALEDRTQGRGPYWWRRHRSARDPWQRQQHPERRALTKTPSHFMIFSVMNCSSSSRSRIAHVPDHLTGSVSLRMARGASVRSESWPEVKAD